MPLLRRPDVAWFLASAFLMMFAHAALYVFYSLWLAQLGYSKFAIGVMWTIGVVAEIVFFYYQACCSRAMRCAPSWPAPLCWRRCASA